MKSTARVMHIARSDESRDVNNAAVLTAIPTQNAIQSDVFFVINYNRENGKEFSSISRMQENGKTLDDQMTLLA
ncbi:hypothetical protein ACS0PU_011243 [Formica fusca]